MWLTKQRAWSLIIVRRGGDCILFSDYSWPWLGLHCIRHDVTSVGSGDSRLNNADLLSYPSSLSQKLSLRNILKPMYFYVIFFLGKIWHFFLLLFFTLLTEDLNNAQNCFGLDTLKSLTAPATIPLQDARSQETARAELNPCLTSFL